MTLRERHYGPYDGPLVSDWRRRLVIPRYAYEEAFASRRFMMLYAACFFPTIVAMLIVFLHHNVNALAMMELTQRDLIQIGPRFFQLLLGIQSGVAFLLALMLGPTLVSADLAHNGLPLYLSRPIDRRDYATGKILVVFLLMSSVTWVASLAVFGLEAGFVGREWFAANSWLPAAIVVQGVSWSALVSILAVALSAWLKWKPVAAGALLFLFLVPTGFAELINSLFFTRWGYLLSPSRSMDIVSDALFRRAASPERMGMFGGVGPPVWAAALALFCFGAAGLWLLHKRLRAHEVVT